MNATTIKIDEPEKDFMQEQVSVVMTRRARVTINVALHMYMDWTKERLQAARDAGDDDGIEKMVGRIFEIDEAIIWMESPQMNGPARQ